MSCVRLGSTEITVHIEGQRCTLVVTEGPDKDFGSCFGLISNDF